MVTKKSVEEQLKKISFSCGSWGKAEIEELPNILLEGERIYECVNGVYEGGFSLLVATDIRVLLIDKKPLNYLTVEDLRFDMINEIDYSHRIVGARIDISAGQKSLSFRSVNQKRLRKLIGHVQDRMAEIKKEQMSHQLDQRQNLEKINEQLQAYLLAQYKHQEDLRRQLDKAKSEGRLPEDLPEAKPIKPSPELADYLFAQNLLKQYGVGKPDEPDSEKAEKKESKAETGLPVAAADHDPVPEAAAAAPAAPKPPVEAGSRPDPAAGELYTAARQEVFGVHQPGVAPHSPAPAAAGGGAGLEINPLRIAYAKLPMALRNRKFGRPSFHAPSPAVSMPVSGPKQTAPGAS